MMTELQLKDDGKGEVKKEKRLKCAEYLSKTIHNMTLYFDNKGKQCRYSAHIVNLSLSLYLRNKNNCGHLRGTRLMNRPHPSTLKNITRHMKYLPGYDPNLYFTVKPAATSSGASMMGHIMVDEIKLKNGLIWNCINNEVIRFISNILNTTRMFENLLGLT